MKVLQFSLLPLPPFRLDLTALALQRRPINQMDSWDGETYSRVVVQNNQPVLVEVRQWGDPDTPRLDITARFEHQKLRCTSDLNNTLNKLLGLQTDLKPFYQFAKNDPILNLLAQRYIGLKPPRFPSVFEALINGIACQQLSLHVGLTLLNRLCAKSGLPFQISTGPPCYSFPSSEQLRTLPIHSFRSLGFSTNKAIAIKNISNEICNHVFDAEALINSDNNQAIARLLTLRGVGRWTAEYVLLRGLGRTSVFPGDDVGARNNLTRWLKLEGKLDYTGVKKTLLRWQPFAGLLYFHLLLEGANLAI